MTNSALLREKISQSGLRMGYIADCMGISRASLYNKISNKREFKASEIMTLAKLLSLNRSQEKEIFFTHYVDE